MAQVLEAFDLLVDDTVPAIRAWIDHSVVGLPTGFADPIRTWLVVLLKGGPRSRPRSHATLYTYFRCIKPHIDDWARRYDHLREITADDLQDALSPLDGHQRRNTVTALRSLFRFSKKRGVIFKDPAGRLSNPRPNPVLDPMTETELRGVEEIARQPAQKVIVALSAVHAARATAILQLTLGDLDLPNRRITIARHPQRLGDLTHQVLRTWLEHRRTCWPNTPNPHLLISRRTALGTDPVSHGYLQFHLRQHGVSLDRIRQDTILHEALTTGADMLHLALVFNLPHATASRYANLAEHLLDDQLENLSLSALPPQVGTRR